MTKKIIVGYDGSDAADRALDHAAEIASAKDVPLLVVHVLEWSPYSFLTREEVAERHKRRTEELARAESAIMDPVRKRLAGRGVTFDTVIRYGHISEIIVEIAKAEKASQIVVGRDGGSGIAARIFGSTAGTLVQIAPVPCTIVP